MRQFVVVLAGALLLLGARLEWPALSHAGPIFNEKPQAPPAAVADIQTLSRAFSELSDRVSPTVVNIYTKSGGDKNAQLPPGIEDQLELFGLQLPQMRREALGSGFVINAEEGYIVTNAHVVKMTGKAAEEIMIKFIGEDNDKGHPAKLIGADDLTDVALLKLVYKQPGLRAVALGDSSQVKVGEWVLAAGNPYGHSNTITQGIISATGRSLEGARSDFLQTSAGINPGNSGGPLINMSGAVIGINSAMDPRAPNIGFAIPINTAKAVISQLVNEGKVRRAWMGLAIEDISDEAAGYMRLKDRQGVLVRQVLAGAPAAKAGVEPYDVIRKINGLDVKSTHDVYKTLDQLSAGKTAELELIRAGSRTVVKVQLSEAPTKS